MGGTNCLIRQTPPYWIRKFACSQKITLLFATLESPSTDDCPRTFINNRLGLFLLINCHILVNKAKLSSNTQNLSQTNMYFSRRAISDKDTTYFVD